MAEGGDFDFTSSDHFRFSIFRMNRQGIEAHRPSELFVRASKTTDRVHNVRVGGYAIKVMEGTLLL
jgi:predicted PhzF superfamily epimerase YddE/YHI9